MAHRESSNDYASFRPSRRVLPANESYQRDGDFLHGPSDQKIPPVRDAQVPAPYPGPAGPATHRFP